MAAKKKPSPRKPAAPKKPAKAASRASGDAKTSVAGKAGPKRKPPGTQARKAAAKPSEKRSTAEAAASAPRSAKPGGPKVETVDGYFDRAGGWQSEAMRKIHDILVDAAEGVEHGIKWAQPVYEKYGPLAFLRSAKDHVTLGFWRGAEMAAPEGLLEGVGDRMKHIKIRSAADIPGAIIDLVKQAVKLNEEKGDPTRKKT